MPKSPEATGWGVGGDDDLESGQWELKRIVPYNPSTLNYKCLRAAGFLHIKWSTW